MLHAHFRKICHLLADFTEWGQLIVLKVLTRYARSQFLSPFLPKTEGEVKRAKPKKFYSDEESDASSSESDGVPVPELDADHALLLKQAGQLIYSRNAGVILEVSTMFFALAPEEDCPKVIKPLVRMVRNRREIAFILLTNISTMASQRPELFRPFMRDFFISSSDPRYIRDLKLDILSNIAADSNIGGMLKEFEVYMRDPDKKFVSQVVESLSRCAQLLPEIAERCMDLLMRQVSSREPNVVARSVVSIRQLLQCNTSLHSGVIRKMARLLDTVSIGSARAAIVWIVGEYREQIPKTAPDCLRKLAKTFCQEEDFVKMQILNLAVKMFLSNAQQTAALFRYIMDLCKYDQNYDLRDRVRLIRALFFKKKSRRRRGKEEEDGDEKAEEDPEPTGSDVKNMFKQVLLSEKPVPVIHQPYKERETYSLSSLSHTLMKRVAQYEDLPEFPLEMPDPSTRDPPAHTSRRDSSSRSRSTRRRNKNKKKKTSEEAKAVFYSSDENKGSSSSSSSSGSDSSSSSSSSSDSDSDDNKKKKTAGRTRGKRAPSLPGYDDMDMPTGPAVAYKGRGATQRVEAKAASSSSSSSSDSDSSDSEPVRPKTRAGKKTQGKKKKVAVSSSDSSSDSDSDVPKKKSSRAKSSSKKTSAPKKKVAPIEEQAQPVDFLAGIDFGAVIAETPAPAPAPTMEDFTDIPDVEETGPIDNSMPGLYLPSSGAKLLVLNPINANGLQIHAVYSRAESFYFPGLNMISLKFENKSDSTWSNISVENVRLESGMEYKGFDPIAELKARAQQDVTIHVNFFNKVDPVKFQVMANNRSFNCKLPSVAGELLRPLVLQHDEFEALQKRLSGMQERTATFPCVHTTELPRLVTTQFAVAALARHDEEKHVYRFCGRRLADQAHVLIELRPKGSGQYDAILNCEDFMFSGHLCNALKKFLG
jgi:AP-3 complex subunit beta